MSHVLVAHGTRKQHGVTLIADLAHRVAALLNDEVHVAFVDVLGPSPSDVLRSLSDAPSVVVPAFLATGYHVRTDIPAHVAVSGHPDVTVTAPLGPSPRLARIVAHRLLESGWQPDDSVILAAAGSTDPAARRDLRAMTARLSALTGSRVELAFAATRRPSVADAVSALRRRGARRVVVASYLLSDGLFQDRLHTSGADVVTDPLGTHPATVRLIANRFCPTARAGGTSRPLREQTQSAPKPRRVGDFCVCSR